VQLAIVVNEAKFAELIHEETDAGPRRPDHLGQRFLTDLCDHRLRLIIFAEVANNSSTRASRFSLELKR
jgi:hypothetical protein